jgi:branched-chain amino acid transport system permease protein
MQRNHLVGVALFAVGIIAAPFFLSLSTATELLIFGLTASAAYLVIGVGGLFSFGQAALFGIGGYTGGWLLAHTDLPLVLPLLAGAAGAGLFAAVMGAMCVRRSSIYFIMLTFAFNQLVYYAIYSWRDVTGGQDGLGDIARPTRLLPYLPQINLDRPVNFYILVAVIVFVSFLALLRIVESPLGRVLSAVKQNPRRAASIGYDIHRAQTVAFALSGVFSGLAGVLYSMLYWIMPIDAVAWVNSGNIIFMVLIGGLNSIFGSLIGAAIFIVLQDSLSLVWDRWPLLFGLIVIGVVLFLRGGVLELGGMVRLMLRRSGRVVAPR